jgi:putative endonuclease
MYYAYILRSQSHPKQIYIGSTRELAVRLKEHNSGKSTHTRKFIPWRLIFYAAFPEKTLAENFERYLKSGSGRAFARRHLLSTSEPKTN